MEVKKCVAGFYFHQSLFQLHTLISDILLRHLLLDWADLADFLDHLLDAGLVYKQYAY